MFLLWLLLSSLLAIVAAGCGGGMGAVRVWQRPAAGTRDLVPPWWASWDVLCSFLLPYFWGILLLLLLLRGRFWRAGMQASMSARLGIPSVIFFSPTCPARSPFPALLEGVAAAKNPGIVVPFAVVCGAETADAWAPGVGADLHGRSHPPNDLRGLRISG